MPQDRPEWQTLNAYADGELSPTDARNFERRIAVEPQLQRDLEEILKLKRALTSMRPSIAEPQRLPGRQPAHAIRPRYAIAATVFGLAVAVTVAAMLLIPSRGNWLERASALHGKLAQQAYVVEERYIPQTVSSGESLEFRAPNLTPSHLYLVDVATSDIDGHEAIAMHYRGLKGCRLTILAIEGADGAAAPPPDTDRLVHTWVHDGFAFAIIADGMDADRFLAVADFAETSIARPAIDGGRQQIAMAETRRTARPCA
jgi:anti-sigma factor RsiW